MHKEIELQIVDRGDVSIEKVAEQFLVEGSGIDHTDGLILLMIIFLLQR